MTEEQTKSETSANEASDNRREQSTIAFPYLDLDAAVEVANAVYNRSGLSGCDLDELAAEMKQTMSGAFRLKTGTARTFELVEREGKSTVKLTNLGRQIVMADTERAARAEAFLRVPLYAEIYEKYKGHLLPPAKALEREMQSLGVARKQTDKARQAFERSARQAGYFEGGDDRLVRPRMGPGQEKFGEKNNEPSSHAETTVAVDGNNGRNSGEVTTGKNHPLIQGLLMTLPEPGENWDAEGRASWLRMAASIFDMIYTGTSSSVVIQTTKKTAADQ
ncbi:hypothetical protein [Pelagibius sp. 7325]|uniref:hypothetical protein n=1 Tax=Pelagibius sp. 7325 TaxID=3131994 RepID=UPI0030ED959A